MKKNYPPLYYSDYLKLDTLLSSQLPKSEEYDNKLAHDEVLFIIVHQVYELWFKQILHELDSVLDLFKRDYIDEKNIGVAVARLSRIIEIQKLLIEQLRVLETMTPLDFLEFRDYLFPASGFQSWQFRLIENKLGLSAEKRILFDKQAYFARLTPEHQKIIRKAEQQPTLFDLVETWLERTPFLEFEGFNFWQSYRKAVEQMLQKDRETIRTNPILSDDEKKSELEGLASTQQDFAALFDERKHEQLVQKGYRRLSFKATQAALLIKLYRDEPILHLPFNLLTVLIDIDEMLTTWRYRHALMVQRMIGAKIGTGGSSGHAYLKKTADSHKIFADLTNLSTYLIPRSALPELPEEVQRSLGFFYPKSETPSV
ncbi:MAG: tryptophan 2,3-dioxygenase family protein [bacterium]